MKLRMLIDDSIEIVVNSSVIITKLKELNINSKMNDVVILPIKNLWKSSNKKVNVKCDICYKIKSISYSMYNKNIKKHNIYTCSNICSNIKNKKTKLEKYGNENYNNLDKIKKTKFEKYGDEDYNNRDKFKNTNLIKYGVDSFSKTNEFKEKVKTTCLYKYKVDNYSKTKEFKNKVKETSLYRYGVDSPNKSELVKKVKKNSMLKKYGYISNSFTEESRNKLKNTNLERYGVEYPMQVVEFCEKQQKNSKKIKYYNDDIYYQSSYEKHFLDYLLSINMLNMVKRGPIIKYESDGNTKIHYPDFYIEKYNLIIEIKSDYYYYKYKDINEMKLKKAIEIGYNYIFIINKKYDYFNEYINIIKKADN